MYFKAGDGFVLLLFCSTAGAEPRFSDVIYTELEIKPKTKSKRNKGTAIQDILC